LDPVPDVGDWIRVWILSLQKRPYKSYKNPRHLLQLEIRMNKIFQNISQKQKCFPKKVHQQINYGHDPDPDRNRPGSATLPGKTICMAAQY
jgi:hypothetical protein